MRGYHGSGSTAKLFLMLITGALVGGVLGDLVARFVPLAGTVHQIGLEPTTLNLGFLQLTLGLVASSGPGTALGLIVGYLAYRKI